MSHERGFRILKIQKTRFYLHGSSVFAFCYFLSFFCVFGRPFENSSFTCMGAQFCEYPPPQDNKKKHKKTPELYQKASPKGEPRTWSLRIAQDDPRWSNMAQDGSKMAQDGPSNSRVSPPSRSEYCQAGRAANMKLATAHGFGGRGEELRSYYSNSYSYRRVLLKSEARFGE